MDKYKNLKNEIIHEMKKNPKITILDLAFMTDHHQRTIQKYVNQLKADGEIERLGSKYGGCWKVCE